MRLRSFDQEVRNYLISSGVDVPFIGDVYGVLKGGTASADFWTRKLSGGNQAPTIAEINGRLTSLQNDVVFIPPESHSLAAALTISANGTHWVGASAPSLMNMRSRIGMSTTFTPMITVSGYGNSFHNLYLMHGTAVGDYIGVSITGSRNTFRRVHFAGPMNAAQASDANFRGVKIAAAETYFKDCFFGNNTQSQDEASALVEIAAGCGVTIFENCIFMMRVLAGDTDPYFVLVTNTSDTGLSIFRKCLFIAEPGAGSVGGTPAVAISFAGSSLGYVILDSDCQFVNVTNITATSTDQYVRMGCVFASTDDDVGMIAATPTLA